MEEFLVFFSPLVLCNWPLWWPVKVGLLCILKIQITASWRKKKSITTITTIAKIVRDNNWSWKQNMTVDCKVKHIVLPFRPHPTLALSTLTLAFNLSQFISHVQRSKESCPKRRDVACWVVCLVFSCFFIKIECIKMLKKASFVKTLV